MNYNNMSNMTNRNVNAAAFYSVMLVWLALFLVISTVSVASAAPGSVAVNSDNMINALRPSLVYLSISSYPYNTYQPWRHSSLQQDTSFACAVGPYEVMTTAYDITDAQYIKARPWGQNEYVTATIKVVDYESNLCLLSLDKSKMDHPLKPVTFLPLYRKGTQVDYYWLGGDGRVRSGRGHMEDHEVTASTVSYTRFLRYLVGNISQSADHGELFCLGSQPIGIAAWSSSKSAGVIPAETINHFLSDARHGKYEGFPAVGFAAQPLIDPTYRSYLKMPDTMKNGIYVASVYTLGTGADKLKKGDVILSIDGHTIDAHGRYVDKKYEQMNFYHLIVRKNVGDIINFKLWRDGKVVNIPITARNFKASQMLVPFYEYDKQPEYIVVAGFVLQKLTRPYFTGVGVGWQGKMAPHLYHYLRDMAFKPTPQRRQIVVLSYVLPADINRGYQRLRQLVVKKYNGKNITCIKDILVAQKLNPDAKFDVIEFENANPIVVLPRSKLARADAMIGQLYGIKQLVHIDQ